MSIKQIGLILCLLSSLSQADNNSLRLCSNALDTCNDLVNAQRTQIDLMNTEIKALEGQVVKEEDKDKLPTWIWVFMGAVMGGVATKLILK